MFVPERIKPKILSLARIIMHHITVKAAKPALAIFRYTENFKMQKFLLVAMLICSCLVTSKAQSKHVLSNSKPLTITSYKVLPDVNYSLSRILRDRSLKYQSDSLAIKKNKRYWIKIDINNPYPDNEYYALSLSLLLNYTIYYLDPATNKWISKHGGLGTLNGYRNRSFTGLSFKKDATSSIYLKIDLSNLPEQQFNFKPAILLQREEQLQHQEERLLDRVLMSSIVLLSLIAYNFYLYIYLKDKAYLYFLVIQAGALLFLISGRSYFNLLLPLTLYDIKVISSTLILYYEINVFLQHIGILVIIWGITNFVRVYLSTAILLPNLDRILRYLLYSYAIFELITSVITISGLFFLSYYTFVIDNIFIQLMLCANLIIAIIGYKRGIPVAKYFLFANTIPIILTLATCIYSVITQKLNPLLPEIAIFSQILTFAVSLVARLKILTSALNEKQIEAIRLEHQVRITTSQNIEIEQKSDRVISMIEQEQTKNEQLTSELENNQREIVGNQIYIQQKNALLVELARQVAAIDMLHPNLKLAGLNNIQTSLRHDEFLNENWGKFKLHFEQLHPNFFDELKAKNDKLTTGELRLSAYLHLNLSTKEIAALLNILPTSVKQAKSRLNKKITAQITKD